MSKRYLILLPSGELYSVDGATWYTLDKSYADDVANEDERVLELVLGDDEDEAP